MPKEPNRTRKHVRNACERCRKQKLKCDDQRPCTLCLRTGVECLPGSDRPQKKRRTNDERQRRSSTVEHGSSTDELQLPTPALTAAASSSTMALVETALQYNSTPAVSQHQSPLRSVHYRRHALSANLVPSNLLDKLRRALPKNETIDLLVKTYFDRVHWFVLVFHQDDFKYRLKGFLDGKDALSMTSLEVTGFLSTLIVVLCVGLECLGPYRASLLEQQGVQRHELQADIEAVLNEAFLDIISLATMESAQTCLLLSVYYLYRGNVQKAWPICGCALRIAQTLELHRSSSAEQAVVSSGMQVHSALILETRKRCWWAIYEVETFCCMLYGFKPAIYDIDCDVDFLDDSVVPSMLGPNLLTYKQRMTRLSVIIKDTLQSLYRRPVTRNGRNDGSNAPQYLVTEVQRLHAELEHWQSELPYELRIGAWEDTGYRSIDDIEHDIGATGQQFAQYAVQLQALTLKLAYESTRILIHRRLLSLYYGSWLAPASPATCPAVPDMVRRCLAACRDAGSQTAELGALPLFRFAARTYAAAYIKTHLFTAGVALCFSTMVEPLNLYNAEAKMQIQKIIKLQKSSSARTLPSSQSLTILENLMRVVLEKELACIMNPSMGSAEGTSDDGFEAVEDDAGAADTSNGQISGRLAGSISTTGGDGESHCAAESSDDELPSSMFNKLQGFEDAFASLVPTQTDLIAMDGVSWDLGQAWMWNFS